MNPPSPVADALAFLDATLDSPSCVLLTPGSRYRGEIRRLIVAHSLAGNRVFDAAIVAVCLEHGVREIVSEDSGMKGFTEIEVRGLS